MPLSWLVGQSVGPSFGWSVADCTEHATYGNIPGLLTCTKGELLFSKLGARGKQTIALNRAQFMFVSVTEKKCFKPIDGYTDGAKDGHTLYRSFTI